MSNASSTRVSFGLETTYGSGTFSGTPAFLRYNSFGLETDLRLEQSDQISSSGNVLSLTREDNISRGSIGTEFSATSYDDLIRSSILGGAWTTPITTTATDIDFDEPTGVISKAAGNSGAVLPGHWIKVTGSTSNDGIYQVASVVGAPATDITIASGQTLVTEAAGDSVTVTVGAFTGNASTVSSFVFEKEYTDLAGNKVRKFKGIVPTSWELGIPSTGKFTSSWNLEGFPETPLTVLTGSPSGPSTTPVYAAGINLLDVYEDTTYDPFNVAEFTLRINPNIRTRRIANQIGPESVGTGRVDFQAAVRTYFSDPARAARYENETPTALALVLGDSSTITASTNEYVIDIPKAQAIAKSLPTEGVSTDVMLNMTYQALQDGSSVNALRIFRW